MEILLILLGLFPVMFLFDAQSGSDDGTEDAANDMNEPPATGVDGDFFSETEETTSSIAGLTGGDTEPDPLDPVSDDDTPFQGADIDPDDVLAPIEEDDEPIEGSEIDPDDVLSPIVEPGEGFSGAGSTLQDLMANESDFATGTEMLGERIGETGELSLGPDDNIFSAEDDGTPGTGSGMLTDWDGTPILSDENAVAVVDGGEGDDEIALGDGASYAFGGEGNDTLSAGEGVAALFGGEGDDMIEGQQTGLGIWVDGGVGHDTITGTGDDDSLFGGTHSADGTGDDDLIEGGTGDDRIAGGYGADTLNGGEGDDVINHLGRLEEEIHWERHDFSWHIDNDADLLDGGEGDDTLIMDRADTATGGQGSDVFWVYFDGASGEGAAHIADFAIGEDFLRVTLNPTINHGDMQVDVGPSDDGTDGIVRVNGEMVAVLQGTPGATAADVYVEVVNNIFVP
ncbi:calcium-binding protein [Maritimibacter sp. HL-12]|uniref:calcium-binding protein n=1 Tax=Maritimibacter sp. HL-12 TaxID=1162418 RepID=UPI000A0F2EF9|nr:calcium-binding protein [Maritimibacter sp. HL-12]SMH46224.1 Hemolysin-type calcium-binding repeat-containing protein [Maritimibacter sp. HL-12]